MGIPSDTIRSAILGVPLNPSKEPDRAGVVRAFEQMDARVIANSAGAIIRNSLAALNASTAPAPGLMAWVMGDATTANNAVYENTGSAVTPAWVKRGPLPYGVIRFVNVGAGTADAIVATSALPAPTESGLALFTMEILAENTGDVTINGTPLLLGNGAEIPAGYLQPGQVMFLFDGTSYRLLYFGDPEAVQAAVEAVYAAFLLLYLGAYANDAAATAAAGTPTIGQKYWNTTDELEKVWNGSGWVAVEAAVATITRSAATGDGGATYTLDSTAQFNNTVLMIDTRVMPRDNTVYTLVDGDLTLSANLDVGVEIEALTFEVSPMGATTADLVSFSDPDADFDGATTVQEALDYLKVNILGAPSTQIARPGDYPGADSTGVADSTAAIVAALASGKPDIDFSGGTWLTDEIDLDVATYPHVKRTFGEGRGTLKQRTANNNLLYCTGMQGIVIEGLRLQGMFSPGLLDASNINNRGIVLEECHGARLAGIYGTRTKFQVVHNLGSDDIIIDGLEGEEIGILFSTRGGNGAFLRNLVATDCIFDDSIFSIGIAYESTDGHAYGLPFDYTMSGARVSGFFNAQGIMAHAGVGLHYSDITIDDAMIGFSFNPASAAGGDDFIQKATVTGLTVTCPDGSPPPSWTGGNACLVIAAGAPTPDIVDVTVTGAVLKNGNRAEQVSTQAAVQLWSTKRVSLLGLEIGAAWATGILLNDDNTGVKITGGGIDSVTPVSGIQYGVDVRQTSNSGNVSGMHFKDMAVGVNRVSGTGFSASACSFESVTTTITP